MLSSLTISPLIRCTTLVPVHILARGLENTLTAYQRCADCGFFRCADPRPTDRLAAFGALLSRPGKPGMYPFLDDRALEFGKYAQHLEERASRRLTSPRRHGYACRSPGDRARRALVFAPSPTGCIRPAPIGGRARRAIYAGSLRWTGVTGF